MFTFNNIDFSAKNMKVVNIQRPLLAPQKISASTIEGKSGEIFNRKVSDVFSIDVEFYLFSNTGLSLISDLRNLAGDLDTTEPARLIFHDEPDKYVMAILENSEVEKRGRYAVINLSFRCLDPHWYAIQDDVYTYTTTGTKNISRKGNAESYPLIEISGVSTAGKYTISANGSTMTYTGALAAGQKIVIDSELLTAYILSADGITKTSILNRLDLLDFPVLSRGLSEFTINASSGATLTQCKVNCRSRWK